MLPRHITLPDLEPTLAVVGEWCIENNNNLIINHIVLIFKKFLYDNRSNHSRIHIAVLKYQLRLTEKVEQKIASKKGKMEFHLKSGIQYCKHFNILQSIYFSPLAGNKNKGGGRVRGWMVWVTLMNNFMMPFQPSGSGSLLIL